ncbi:hypothetical protein QZM99_31710 [Burkholderia gladioli]|uniref:hypothetical protein n=1 Tax=Burkholderia gladioli TaxID=28095 RepID=UPI002655D4E7|nr:hypothetical protein [Burkholderia gladioli]MDN7922651.1 hypothetical protein [Burkholderia gladioli]
MKMNYNHTVADAVQFEYRTEVVAVAHDATARAEAVNLKKYVAFDMAAQQYNTITNGGVEPWTGCARRSSRGIPSVADTARASEHVDAAGLGQ